MCSCRGQLLCVRCPEADLARSRLQVSLLSASSQRPVAKGSIRLSGLLPGQHYSIALCLTDTCTLYITLVLGLGSSTLLAALQGSGLAAADAANAGQLQLLQVGLPVIDQPLVDLLPQALLQQGDPFEVLAVWAAGARSSNVQQPQQPIYTVLDGRDGSEAVGAAVLRSINSNVGLLAVGGPSRAGSAASSRDATGATDAGAANISSSSLKGVSGVLACIPIHSSQQEDDCWPDNHQVRLCSIRHSRLWLHVMPWFE